jgi:hypothetical protein
MAYGSVNADLMTTSDGVSSSGLYGFKNRLINSAMVIDQRNAGASVNPIGSSGFAVDRWQYFTNATAGAFNAGQNLNSVTPPAGFTKYLGYQVASTQTPTGTNAYFFGQKIEGFNVADLGWGAAGAQPIAISFWVRSSVTGTHSGNVQNTSNVRSYVFSYSINSANTWEYKTITIAGDTTGTWPTDNTTGLIIYFNLGCGTSLQTTAGSWNAAQYIGVTGGVSVVSNASATWYVTGVQLEKGSTATSFDYRPYGTEFNLVQRYFQKTNINNVSFLRGGINGVVYSSTGAALYYTLPVQMRSAPSITRGGTNDNFYIAGISSTVTATLDTALSSVDTVFLETTSLSSGANGYQIVYNGQLSLNSEL